MHAKIKACGKLQLMEEKRRDRVGQKLDSMRQRYVHIAGKISELSVLKSDSGQSAYRSPSFNSATLMNLTRVDHMLQKLLVHCEEEQAVLQAQCSSVQKELEHRHARVKGLENALERWKTKQSYEKARIEQRMLEEMINARIKMRAL